MSDITFDQLGLDEHLLAAVKFQGYIKPSPIQAQAIPVILEGRDILAGAQTGTGKTAAFTLPTLQLLNKPGDFGHRPRALVLTPTRELAAQVAESVATYGQNFKLRSTVIFGGVGINPQIQKLRRGVDIVVATPGRLIDLANQKAIDLSRIEVFILDEADRMLDMGFIHDIKRIIKLLPKKRQNMLFSATYSDEIKRLSQGLLNNPAEVEVARRNTTAETVTQNIYHVNKNQKRSLLTHLIKENNWFQVLIFTRTKHGANRLCKQLTADGIIAEAIHGNKSQNARTRALADFKSNKAQALVATDIAARGIDIDQLPHVVNYELPNIPEDYVHRIGRTGRAGAEGLAVSLVSGDERDYLRSIERLLKTKIPVKEAPGFEVIKDAEPDPRANNNRGGGGQRRNNNNRGGGGGQNKKKSSNGGGNRSGGQNRSENNSSGGSSETSKPKRRFFKGKPKPKTQG
jgi:ATP-dependent RNA helicase RhlE